LNRAVLTGEIASASSRTTWQNSLNASPAHHEDKTASGIGYTLANTLPNIAEANVLAVTYYDDYTFPKPANLGYVNTYVVNALSMAKNLQTGARVRMLAGANVWLVSATYYDAEYRAIQTVRELHDLGAGAIERVSMQYKFDLASVIAQEKSEQIIATGTNVHQKIYEYDHADRLLSVKEKVVNGSKAREAMTIAQRYNALGQLQQKWFHSEDGINFRRRTTYTNNIRGWLAQGQTFYKIKENEPDSSFYNFALSYANGNNYTNGNISQMQWSGKAENTFTKGLAFTYDGANRLLGSTGLNNYAETEGGISYDKNGNIKTLIRSGVVLDNLSYAYVGNRLSAVTDGSGSNTGVKSGVNNYAYDGNGNMISDGNRGAVLSYNYLNLPKTVTIAGKTLTYDYDAAGTKHKYVADTLTAKYAGDFEYDQSNVFKRLSISEGQAVYRKDSIRFDYYLKDHLGNVRVVFDETGRILQKTDYYPFGLEIDRNAPVQTPSARNNVNRLLYNGKELQVGTGYLDYGARMYLPEVGRWGVVDPMSEITGGFSPFTYGNDNPVLMIDPNGMRTTYNWDTGKYEDEHGGNVGFEQAKHEYGVGGTSGGNINCCPDSPNILAAEAKKDNSVKGRLASAGWKSGQPMPAVDGIETDLSIESVVIPLVKPVEWMVKPLVGLIRAQWLASRVAKNLLNPKEIHFMQNSIKNVTGEFTVLGNAEALRAGTLDPRLLTMSVWKDASGKVWTLDHRRLAAFRISGLKEAPVQWANPSGQMWKLTTTNAGTSIKLKLGQGQSITVK
jgi:RHS repeat-associated protein